MSAQDRAALDGAIGTLTGLSGGLTLEDFRLAQSARARESATQIRMLVIVGTLIFLLLAFGDLVFAAYRTAKDDAICVAMWAIALGGLGACSSIFLDVLKLIPQQTLKSSDVFEVIGRIILGVLFSFVLCFSFNPQGLAGFFDSIKNLSDAKPNVMLILPFISGYSLPLVLGLLDKAIRAVELTLGLEDRRLDAAQDSARLPSSKK